MRPLLAGDWRGSVPHLWQFATHPRWVMGYLADGAPLTFPNVQIPGVGAMPSKDVGAMLESTVVTWSDFRWIRDAWNGPIVVKGVHTGDDARRAVDAGAQAVIVSNHGGRQLDGVPASLRALPEVIAAVGDRTEVLVDGGIRRGGDVVKALCLGARAVLVGRAYAWALAAAELRRRHRTVVERRDRTGAERSRCPQKPRRGARARLRKAARPAAGHARHVDRRRVSRAAVAGLRAENGLDHEATIVGAFPVIAGALVQRAKGSEPVAPNPNVSHSADTLAMLLGRKPAPREVAALGRLFRHGLRSRHERLDLHDARRGVDPGGFVRGRDRRLLRAHRSAAWRRAGAGASKCSTQLARASASSLWLDAALARGERLMGFGHRVYRVRDPRADVLKAAIADRPPTAPIFRSPARWSRISGRPCARKIRSVRSKPTSSSSPRCCSTRFRSQGRPLRRSSRWRARPAGPRMPGSSSAPGG